MLGGVECIGWMSLPPVHCPSRCLARGVTRGRSQSRAHRESERTWGMRDPIKDAAGGSGLGGLCAIRCLPPLVLLRRGGCGATRGRTVAAACRCEPAAGRAEDAPGCRDELTRP